jgi:hypothetical protein
LSAFVQLRRDVELARAARAARDLEAVKRRREGSAD